MSDFHEKAEQLEGLISVRKNIVEDHDAAIAQATADRQTSVDEIDLARRTQAAFKKFLNLEPRK